MIKLLILVTNIYSHTELTITAHPGCENLPNIQYYVESDLRCVPSDLIFKNGFEGDGAVVLERGDGIEK